MELAGAEARDAALQIEGAGAGLRRVEGGDVTSAHEIDALDRGRSALWVRHQIVGVARKSSER